MITNRTRRCNNSNNSINNNKTTHLFMEASAEAAAGLLLVPTATAAANVREAEGVDLPAAQTTPPIAIIIIQCPPQQPITAVAAHRQPQQA